MPSADNEGHMAEVAEEVLERLLDEMGISASVMPAAGAAPVTLNIGGDDLGILIGRRGQTLACLQHIVRLIVSRETGGWAPVVIDVEGYKQRRYQALEALAYRIAEQVKTRRVPFTLEPMPAYERRIIHLALVDHPGVTTQSVGEGEERKVVITPKR